MADMPVGLQAALGALAAGADERALTRDARAISEAYRERTGTGARLLTRPSEAAAYALSRMPATFAAVHAALSEALRISGCEMRTLLDCGAGTGAASWAADALLPLEGVTCLEREEAMQAVGQSLMRAGGEALRNASWTAWDAMDDRPLPRAELVVEGYMLGELPPRARQAAAIRLWEAAQELLLLVEPGTPQGFANLAAVREALVTQGAHVAAPCPGGGEACPMQGGDWCHFTVRVRRTRLHRQLKGGEAPFEDEKFAYLALTRTPPRAPCGARVLRHPQIAPGRIALTLCEAGERRERVVTKKDPLWKRARKIGAGDAL